MLTITIPERELWDEANEVFISTKEQTLDLEHSLVSLSKWESKWCKPFLSKQEKTTEEITDYIKCMTLNNDVDPIAYNFLSNDNITKINDYISAPMTATWFSKDTKAETSKEQVTSELIYYWMIAFNIPSEYQHWHLNRLLTLIRVCNVKNNPEKKKMSQREIMSNNAALNAARRKQLNSKG